MKGLRPANSAWFWGAGKKPALTSFEAQTGKKGVMISAVDLLKGIAVGASMDNVIVEGANGNNVMLFDMSGRLLATKRDDYSRLEFEVPISGAYFVKIGNFRAKKVVVIK
jgi:2,3-bisphosphoglycerate-independent phosphoglycerate mutase